MKNSKEYLDKISKIIDKPYFYEMRNYGITDLEETEYVLRKIYDDTIRIVFSGRIRDFRINDINGNMIYFEEYNGDWVKTKFNENGKQIYLEDKDGYWEKWEYNSIGKRIYYEMSNGYWCKYEYNSLGTRVYLEDSNRVIINYR
jgi:hypothetical protein